MASQVDYISEQPKETRQPQVAPVVEGEVDEFEEFGDGRVSLPTWATVKHKLTTREGWLGDYGASALPSGSPLSRPCPDDLPSSAQTLATSVFLSCLARSAAARRRSAMRASTASTSRCPFCSLLSAGASFPACVRHAAGPDRTSRCLTLSPLRLQHALAMLAGLITPPIIFAGQLGFDGGRQNQMVAVSLIASGFLSMIQMTRMPIPFTRKKYWLGTGLITVVGTSFATLSTASAIFAALYADGTCPSSVVNGVTVRGACPEAYGMLLGTSCLCSLLCVAASPSTNSSSS